MNLNLSLLLPEFMLCAVLLMLLLKEILSPKETREPFSTVGIIPLCGTILAFFAILPFTSKIGTAFNGMYIQDPFAAFFKAFFALTVIVIMQMSRDFFLTRAEKTSEFFLILICTLIGLFILVSANDFIVMFVALEVVTLSFYILVSYLKSEMTSIEAGIKYLIVGSLASAFMIFGISLIYIVTGSTAFGDVRIMQAAGQSPMMLLGLIMILAGVGFKVASVPFHFWVPDVYQGAPTPIVAFLSVGSKAAGVALLLRVLYTAFPDFEAQRTVLFTWLAVATLLYGNLCALLQTNVKRLLGYSSIGHAGYLLIAIASGGMAGTTSVLYYLIAYGFTTLALFMAVTIAGQKLGSDEISSYRGLAKKHPFLAGILFLALLSSAGVPPLAGFGAKFFVLLTAVNEGLVWLALFGALTVPVGLYYYLNLVRVMYFEDSGQEIDTSISVASRIIFVILAAGILIIGLYQAPFLAFAKDAASYLF